MGLEKLWEDTGKLTADQIQMDKMICTTYVIELPEQFSLIFTKIQTE